MNKFFYVSKGEFINITKNRKLERYVIFSSEFQINLFGEIDTLYLNFSDPWPKKRHEKRRLTSSSFLERYDKIFKNGNTIIMKTDNRKLFEYSLMSFTDYGYKIDELSLDYHADETDIVETEYEKKFVAKGNVIYKVNVKK